jgi:4-alpha-glucanotransferase
VLRLRGVNAQVRRLVREALDALGIRRLLLGVHDAAFPMGPEEDVGRGTPSSRAAAEFLAFVASLGFDGIQLGPHGATSPANPSPYDAALFSRDPLGISLPPLTRPEWGALVPPETLEAIVATRPAGGPAAHRHAFQALSRALSEAAGRFRRARAAGAGGPVAALAGRFDAFRARHAGWLERDALHQALQREQGGARWQDWPSAAERDLFAGTRSGAGERFRALLARHALAVEDYAFVQFVAHEQHDEVRQRARSLGLALFGDLQTGMSERDAWFARGFVLRDWQMGAPPSRTNPEGQPWGFPVLDPRRYYEDGASGARLDGPAVRFVRARARKVFAEYDGLRIDHPHGLVSPWVYRPEGDPGAAVRAGARLFDTPHLPEHPGLAAFAIAREDQLDPGVPRHADGWVVSLDAEQLERYAALFDVVMACAHDPRDVACEILSTQPYPLRRVIERHGLGRFRVTQKASLEDPGDVYRGENARPEDWIMLGNHDTRTIWSVAERWVEDGSARRRAEYLASRLLGDRQDREGWARGVAANPRALAQAQFAELFVGPARNVLVYFTDLLGSRSPYNTPGTVSDANWSQRLPDACWLLYRERLARGAALDVPRALAAALESPRPRSSPTRRSLAAALRRAPGWQGGELT